MIDLGKKYLVPKEIQYAKLKKLIEAKVKYDKVINNFRESLKPHIQFDFFIMHQPSDGFVIVHDEFCHNAPLYKCIDIINAKGTLCYEDYIKECI